MNGPGSSLSEGSGAGMEGGAGGGDVVHEEHLRPASGPGDHGKCPLNVPKPRLSRFSGLGCRIHDALQNVRGQGSAQDPSDTGPEKGG
jgi:hypothetical protein